MPFISSNLQEGTLGGSMWMPTLITVIATLCLPCCFSFVLFEEKENQCMKLHLSTAGSLQFLWVRILAFVRGRILKLHGSSMAIPLIQNFRILQISFGGFHIHFAHGWTNWVANARGIFHSVSCLTYVWAKPSYNSTCPDKMHIGCVLEERSLVFPQNLNNGFNNNPKRFFLVAMSSNKLFKRITMFCFFLLLYFSSRR